MGNCVGGKGSKKDPTILTEEEIKLLLDNTKLNRAQIVALHDNFLKECPTGKLTKKDFVKLFKEVHPSENKKEKADKFCEYVFKVIDRDNLGYISFQDFVLCFSLTSYGDFRQKCEFAFRLYDLDKDGKISKKEMTQVLEALYDLSGITDRKGDRAPAKKVEEIMKKLNQSNDSQVQPSASVLAAPVTNVTSNNIGSSPSSSSSSSPSKDEKKRFKIRKKDSKEVKAPKEKKEKQAKKESKPVKEPKQTKTTKVKVTEFITKEQFIDACSIDESIKTLFVDSIFAGPTDQKAKDTISIAVPSVNVKGQTIQANLSPVAVSPAGISIKSKTVVSNDHPSNTNVTTSTIVDVLNEHGALKLAKDEEKLVLPESNLSSHGINLPEINAKKTNSNANLVDSNVNVGEESVKGPDLSIGAVHANVKAPEASAIMPDINLNEKLNHVAADINNTIDNLNAQISASLPDVDVKSNPESVSLSVEPLKIEASEINLDNSISIGYNEENKNKENKNQFVLEAGSIHATTS